MAALKEGPVYDVTVESGLLVVDGNDLPIVHARPDGMPDAGLVLHPDIMGLRPLFEDMARRLATYGFGVCAIEPYAHVDAEHRANVEARMAAAKLLDDDTQLADLDAAANLLVVEDDVTRVGGARVLHGRLLHVQGRGHRPLRRRGRVLRDVAHARGLARPRAQDRSRSTSPREMCPTLAIFGSNDPYTPPEDIDALRDAWKDRDDCEIIVIEGAEHGFVHDPDRPIHRADDAAALWPRAIAWLRG